MYASEQSATGSSQGVRPKIVKDSPIQQAQEQLTVKQTNTISETRRFSNPLVVYLSQFQDPSFSKISIYDNVRYVLDKKILTRRLSRGHDSAKNDDPSRGHDSVKNDDPSRGHDQSRSEASVRYDDPSRSHGRSKSSQNPIASPKRHITRSISKSKVREYNI